MYTSCFYDTTNSTTAEKTHRLFSKVHLLYPCISFAVYDSKLGTIISPFSDFKCRCSGFLPMLLRNKELINQSIFSINPNNEIKRKISFNISSSLYILKLLSTDDDICNV